MTRVKVKRAFVSKSSSVRAPQQHHHHHHHRHEDPAAQYALDDEERELDDEEAVEDAPYVYKRRKRTSAATATAVKTHSKPVAVSTVPISRHHSCNNSSQESSSSQDSSSSSEDDDHNDHHRRHNNNGYPPELQNARGHGVIGHNSAFGNPRGPRPVAVEGRYHLLPPQRGGILLKVNSNDSRNDFSDRSQNQNHASSRADGVFSHKNSWASDSPHESFSSRDHVPSPSSLHRNWPSEMLHDHNQHRRSESMTAEELNTALNVIRKIMKMEAAEPFNAPVDPIALGIPDYFDVVKRPMDLGTICKKLERGSHYRSSQDVYEDVQLVWTNCRTYNQKGDPILDLMARVKKNFMKYWTAAGLYTEKHQGQQPVQKSDKGGGKPEITHKSMPKKDFDLHYTPGKPRRASGTGHHKADCSCVVCTGVRRKLAREGKLGASPCCPPGASKVANGTPAREETMVQVKSEPNVDPRFHVEEKRGYVNSNEFSGDEVDEGQTDTLEAVKEESTRDQKKYKLAGGIVPKSERDLSEDFKEGSPAEDTEPVENDCGEMLDTEMDDPQEEEGVRYYPASYEMPLRSIHPTILEMGRKLFANSSTWSSGSSICRHSTIRSANPILETVSIFLSTKNPGC